MLPLVITVEQADGGTRRYAFAESPVSIGRNPFAELQLTEPFISRWEGTLRFDATEITFFNLGATNATYVDGKLLTQLEDDVPLSVDSVLTLGELKLRFSREPVPEADLRRKGKRRPTRENLATGLKTQYLDVPAWAKARPAAAGAAQKAKPDSTREGSDDGGLAGAVGVAGAAGTAAAASWAPAAAASWAPAAAAGAREAAGVPAAGVPAAAFQPLNGAPFAVVPARRAPSIAPQSCIALGDEPAAQRNLLSGPTLLELDAAAEQQLASARQSAPAVAASHAALPSASRHGEAAAGARSNGSSAAARSNGAAAAGARSHGASDGAASFTRLRESYHEARAALLADVRAQYAALPAVQRPEFLTWLIRREPTLASDPDMQVELQATGVQAPLDIPEFREWLRAISPDLVPDGIPFDGQRALGRVLGLLEVLVQSLAEIHDAQESVRRRWLGRSARRSVLQSDDGNAVLAYLLNPRADWNERLRELEQSVREAVTHELALFRATLDGARSLMNTLSPETIASSTAGDDEIVDDEPGAGFWTRLLCKDAGDIGLWRKFLSLYDELTDGARYERVFLGRVFSRSYLAAMGRPEDARG